MTALTLSMRCDPTRKPAVPAMHTIHSPRYLSVVMTLAIACSENSGPSDQPANLPDGGIEMPPGGQQPRPRPTRTESSSPEPNAQPRPRPATPTASEAPSPTPDPPDPDPMMMPNEPEPVPAEPTMGGVARPEPATPPTETTPVPSSEPPPEAPPTALCPDAPTNPTFYVCDCGEGAAAGCVAGDDANAGTTLDAPWRSYEKARLAFQELEEGQSIAFCQGGVFPVTDAAGRYWVNLASTPENPVVVADYTPTWSTADLPRPLFDAEGRVGFALEDPGDPEPDGGYQFLNLWVRGTGDDRGFFFYNDVKDVLLCNVRIEGFSRGVHIAGSNPPAENSDGKNARIILRNSEVIDNAGQGWLGGGDGCSIEYSKFENNGFATASLNHNIYLSPTGLAVGMRVVGNDLYRATMVDGMCAGVSLVAHGEFDDLLIEGNTVREDLDAADQGCWGISVDTAHDSAESFRRVVIRSNRVINVGNVGIGLNGCRNCTIENNVIVNEQPFGARGIMVPVREREERDQSAAAVTVRNNSLYLAGGGTNLGIAVGGEGEGYTVVSNAVQYGGTGDFSCFRFDLPEESYEAIDHNLCHAPASASFAWEVEVGALAEWVDRGVFDATSQITDPRFSAPTSPEFDLASGADDSPLIDGGNPNLSSPRDILGRRRGEAPDIGAFEWQSATTGP